MNKISIIVPVYNVEKYLDKCITSILEQSYADFELILINDGSTDRSGIICDEYKKSDSRVIVIHQENKGLAAARNTGIEKSRGKFITFIDSDDYIHFDMIKVLYSNIIKYKGDISICKYHMVYDENKNNEINYKNNTKQLSNIEAVKLIVEKSQANMIVACCKLYDKNLFNNIRYPIGKCHEDEFITYKLLYESNTIVVSDAKLYYYLQRTNSITGKKFSIKRLDKLEALQQAITYFEDNKNKELIYLARIRYLINIQIAYFKVKYEMKPNNEVLSMLINLYRKEFKKCSVKNIKRVSWLKQIQVLFFNIYPNLYCTVVKVLLPLLYKTKVIN